MARGSERYGLFASSNAARLKPRGIYYAKDRSSLSPENWFLNSEDDIRSSYFLEAVASEFETQGLELSAITAKNVVCPFSKRIGLKILKPEKIGILIDMRKIQCKLERHR